LFVFSRFKIPQTFSLLKSANQVMTCVEFGCYFGSGRVFRRPAPLPFSELNTNVSIHRKSRGKDNFIYLQSPLSEFSDLALSVIFYNFAKNG